MGEPNGLLSHKVVEQRAKRVDSRDHIGEPNGLLDHKVVEQRAKRVDSRDHVREPSRPPEPPMVELVETTIGRVRLRPTGASASEARR